MTTDEWVPHQRETWPWRIGRLREAVVFRDWRGWQVEPRFVERTVPAGTLVKIVMVSRLGDVGITDRLDAEQGYQARVLLEQLNRVEEGVK